MKMCMVSLVTFLPCLFCGFILVVSFFLCEFLGNYFTSACNLWKPERKPRRAQVLDINPEEEEQERRPGSSHRGIKPDATASAARNSGHTCNHGHPSPSQSSSATPLNSTAPSLDQLDAPPSYETCFPLHRSLHEMTEEVKPICCRLCKRRK